MRPIDADELLRKLEEYFNEKEQDAKFTGNRGSEVSWNDAIYYIKTAPSAQTEIIRCKKCKHWRSSDHTCHEHSLVSPMMANDFCSRAERREE